MTTERPVTTTALPRAVRIGAPAAVLGLAAATRLIGLNEPSSLIFDETYYVKDALSLLQLGYEGSWAEDANALFEAGTPGTAGSEGDFVAHPPLGKWVIALGMLALGPESPAGWRLGTAITGIVLVGLVMVAAHLLMRTFSLTIIAGGLIAIDGNAIVMSRVALLDGILATLVLLAVIFVVLDRQQSRDRLAAWLARRRELDRPTDWGPALWARPWLIAAGATFGLAAGVKWSALYFFAAFAVLTVVADGLDRRRAGLAFWASGTLLKQAPTSFLLMLPVALVAHLLTWLGWLTTAGGYGRSLDANPFAALWRYQRSVYGYHVGESSPHAYESEAITWPLLLRPTYMHYEELGGGLASAVSGIPNPLIWWASWAAVIAIVIGCAVRAARIPVGSAFGTAIVLTGVGAGWLPWLLYPERTTFFFYTIVLLPFLILALTAMLGAIIERGGRAAVAVILGVAFVISVFFLPLWLGWAQPLEQFPWRYWLPTWV